MTDVAKNQFKAINQQMQAKNVKNEKHMAGGADKQPVKFAVEGHDDKSQKSGINSSGSGGTTSGTTILSSTSGTTSSSSGTNVATTTCTSTSDSAEQSTSVTRDSKNIKDSKTGSSGSDGAKKDSPHIQISDVVESISYVEPSGKGAKEAWTKSHHPNVKLPLLDELEMKSRGFINKECSSGAAGVTPGVVFAAGARVPFDELAMRQSGFIDKKCHHMTEAELNDDRLKKTAESSPDGSAGEMKLRFIGDESVPERISKETHLKGSRKPVVSELRGKYSLRVKGVIRVKSIRKSKN